MGIPTPNSIISWKKWGPWPGTIIPGVYFTQNDTPKAMKTGATAVSTARRILNQWVCRSLMTQGCCQDIWSSWLKNPRQCVDVTWLSNTHFFEYFSSRMVTFSFKHYLVFVFFSLHGEMIQFHPIWLSFRKGGSSTNQFMFGVPGFHFVALKSCVGGRLLRPWIGHVFLKPFFQPSWKWKIRDKTVWFSI